MFTEKFAACRPDKVQDHPAVSYKSRAGTQSRLSVCVPALQKHAPAFRGSRQSILHCGNIDKHHDIVAEASADTEKMEELMVSEALAHTVKKWKL